MSTVNYAIILIGLFIGFFYFRRYGFLPENKNNKTHEKPVSVIIPVRNEGHNIGNLLKDLSDQDYGNIEIICVDDNSSDDTAAIIRGFGTRYILNEALPDGWKGKPWACQTGASAASGEILLFIDADVRLGRNAVSSLVSEHVRTGSPVSVQPYHTVKKPHEYISMFFNMIQTGATGICAAGSTETSGMFGPVFLVPRTTFDSLNGFESVRNETVEDFFLGKLYEKENRRIRLYLGGGLISFRMYPEGTRTLIEGWSKNFSKGASAVRTRLLLAFVIWVTYLTVLPIESAVAVYRGNYLVFAILAAVYVITVFSLRRISGAIGSYPFVCHLLYPVLISLFLILFLYSLLAIYVFRSTRWKGRRV